MQQREGSPPAGSDTVRIALVVVGYIGLLGLFYWLGDAVTPHKLRERQPQDGLILGGIGFALTSGALGYLAARRWWRRYPRRCAAFLATFPLLCSAIAALLCHWLGTRAFNLSLGVWTAANAGFGLVRFGNPFTDSSTEAEDHHCLEELENACSHSPRSSP